MITIQECAPALDHGVVSAGKDAGDGAVLVGEDVDELSNRSPETAAVHEEGDEDEGDVDAGEGDLLPAVELDVPV